MAMPKLRPWLYNQDKPDSPYQKQTQIFSEKYHLQGGEAPIAKESTGASQ